MPFRYTTRECLPYLILLLLQLSSVSVPQPPLDFAPSSLLRTHRLGETSKDGCVQFLVHRTSSVLINLTPPFFDSAPPPSAALDSPTLIKTAEPLIQPTCCSFPFGRMVEEQEGGAAGGRKSLALGSRLSSLPRSFWKDDGATSADDDKIPRILLSVRRLCLVFRFADSQTPPSSSGPFLASFSPRPIHLSGPILFITSLAPLHPVLVRGPPPPQAQSRLLSAQRQSFAAF